MAEKPPNFLATQMPGLSFPAPPLGSAWLLPSAPMPGGCHKAPGIATAAAAVAYPLPAGALWPGAPLPPPACPYVLPPAWGLPPGHGGLPAHAEPLYPAGTCLLQLPALPTGTRHPGGPRAAPPQPPAGNVLLVLKPVGAAAVPEGPAVAERQQGGRRMEEAPVSLPSFRAVPEPAALAPPPPDASAANTLPELNVDELLPRELREPPLFPLDPSDINDLLAWIDTIDDRHGGTDLPAGTAPESTGTRCPPAPPPAGVLPGEPAAGEPPKPEPPSATAALLPAPKPEVAAAFPAPAPGGPSPRVTKHKAKVFFPGSRAAPRLLPIPFLASPPADGDAPPAKKRRPAVAAAARGPPRATSSPGGPKRQAAAPRKQPRQLRKQGAAVAAETQPKAPKTAAGGKGSPKPEDKLPRKAAGGRAAGAPGREACKAPRSDLGMHMLESIQVFHALGKKANAAGPARGAPAPQPKAAPKAPARRPPAAAAAAAPREDAAGKTRAPAKPTWVRRSPTAGSTARERTPRWRWVPPPPPPPPADVVPCVGPWAGGTAGPTPLEEQEESVPIGPEQRPERERLKRQAQRQRQLAAQRCSLGRLQFFVQRQKDMAIAKRYGYP